MPVSKKHHKKRRKQAKPRQGEYTSLISFGGIEIPDDLIKQFHSDGVAYYVRGKEDNANRKAALTLAEFIEKFGAQESGPFDMMLETIIRAQHSQYIDGYTGAAYRDRVTFERDF